LRKSAAPAPLTVDFAHVGDVEDAGGVADGEMLLNDAGVLHAFPSRQNQSNLAPSFWCAEKSAVR